MALSEDNVAVANLMLQLQKDFYSEPTEPQEDYEQPQAVIEQLHFDSARKPKISEIRKFVNLTASTKYLCKMNDNNQLS